jgi:hypothetical protein
MLQFKRTSIPRQIASCTTLRQTPALHQILCTSHHHAGHLVHHHRQHQCELRALQCLSFSSQMILHQVSQQQSQLRSQLSLKSSSHSMPLHNKLCWVIAVKGAIRAFLLRASSQLIMLRSRKTLQVFGWCSRSAHTARRGGFSGPPTKHRRDRICCTGRWPSKQNTTRYSRTGSQRTAPYWSKVGSQA